MVHGVETGYLSKMEGILTRISGGFSHRGNEVVSRGVDLEGRHVAKSKGDFGRHIHGFYCHFVFDRFSPDSRHFPNSGDLCHVGREVLCELQKEGIFVNRNGGSFVGGEKSIEVLKMSRFL